MVRWTWITFALALTACGAQETRAPQTEDVPRTPDGQYLLLRTQDGYEAVPEVNVTSLQITVHATRREGGPLTRAFSGASAWAVLRQLHLSRPESRGVTSSLVTGRVTVEYRSSALDAAKLKKFVIRNGNLLEDEQYPTVGYKLEQKLTRKWLLAQP